MKLFVVLPIYNEVGNLATLVHSIDEVCRNNGIDYCLVCVDDGSTDRSGELLCELAGQFPLEIVTHRRNRGLGETIRDGFEVAADLADPTDIIARMDADCTHEASYLPRLIEAINGGADIAITSRFVGDGGEKGLTLDRQLISRAANMIFRICFPLGGVREYTCGYRAYRASLIQAALRVYGGDFVHLRGFGFCCTVEKLLKLRLLGAKITEVPFVLRYDLKSGPSKMVFNVTVLGYAVMVIMYHWPWGGWRSTTRRKLSENPEKI